MSDQEPAGTRTTRRTVLGAAAATAAAAATGACDRSPSTPAPPNESLPIETRVLGKTGVEVEAVSLGGEGVLRTEDNAALAVPVILEALRLGVRYCDTAPAYKQSQDYYGLALKEAGPGAREQIFLASKTHVRDRDGSLALLDDSLTRLGTDHLDLWQLHDLRSMADIDTIFGPGGAIEAVEEAKADGRVRFVGITGHNNPEVLLEAMDRYPVDTVLCAINPSDPRRLPFLTSVVPAARARNIGVIGMKVMGARRLLDDAVASVEECIRYGASQADTVIIGCSSVAEVQENLGHRHGLRAMAAEERAVLEARVAPTADRYDYYKRQT